MDDFDDDQVFMHSIDDDEHDDDIHDDDEHLYVMKVVQWLLDDEVDDHM